MLRMERFREATLSELSEQASSEFNILHLNAFLLKECR